MVSYCENAITYYALKKGSKKCFELFLYKLPIIKEMLAASKIPFDATIRLQNASSSLSDFYGIWLAIIRKLDRLAGAPNQITTFASTLLSKIESRSQSLLNNEAMMCAVFLDKRFYFKLSFDEKRIARLALEKLFERSKKAKELESAIMSVDKEKEDTFEEECVALGLDRTFHESKFCKNDKSFLNALESYEAMDRLHHETNMLAFWKEQKENLPEVYDLVSIIYAIPPTQCTVERSFSILGYIYNQRRTRLSPSLLDDMLLVNLNREKVDSINEVNLSNEMNK